VDANAAAFCISGGDAEVPLGSANHTKVYSGFVSNLALILSTLKLFILCIVLINTVSLLHQSHAL
jgi:hypothetical protein